MRFSTTLNNQKCLEWGINATQGILVALLYEANSWAKEEMIDNKVYYFVSRNLVLKELPMFFEKADTVYRNLKLLAEKEIIEYIKHKGMDLIRLTEKGKSWNFIENNSEISPNIDDNSEKNPSEFGKKSENDSEKNPTNKDTNNKKDTSNNTKEKNIKKEKSQTEVLTEYVDTLNLDAEKKEIFKKWILYKKDNKQYKNTMSIDTLIKKWGCYSIVELTEIIENSIANGYQGLFELKNKNIDMLKKDEKTNFIKPKSKQWYQDLKESEEDVYPWES